MTNAVIVSQDGYVPVDPEDEILPERLPVSVQLSPGLARARSLALRLVALGTLATAAATFSQSYRGLYEWAAGHLVTGNWAYWWPVQIDTFIVVPELVLFTGIVDRWPARARVTAWVTTGLGTTVSVAANVGHAATHDLVTRLTFAVPPLAAACTLAFGLMTLKKVVSRGK